MSHVAALHCFFLSVCLSVTILYSTVFWGWQVLWQGHSTNPWIAGGIFDLTTDRRATEWTKVFRHEVFTHIHAKHCVLFVIECHWSWLFILQVGDQPLSLHISGNQIVKAMHLARRAGTSIQGLESVERNLFDCTKGLNRFWAPGMFYVVVPKV